jgi:hypothetical protein
VQHYGKDWKAQGFIREYMASYSIYRNSRFAFPPLNCMVTKLVPASKIETFKILHGKRSKILQTGTGIYIFLFTASSHPNKTLQKSF